MHDGSLAQDKSVGRFKLFEVPLINALLIVMIVVFTNFSRVC